MDKTIFAYVTISNNKYHLIKATKVQESENCPNVFEALPCYIRIKMRFFMVLFVYVMDSSTHCVLLPLVTLDPLHFYTLRRARNKVQGSPKKFTSEHDFVVCLRQ